MQPTGFFATFTRLLAACLLTVLAACGGGGDDNAVGEVRVSKQAAETASENVVIPSDSAQAMSATMSAARFVVGVNTASVTIPCSLSGSAMYQITAGSNNGSFDAGDGYRITFSNCSSNDGSTVNGGMDFSVNTASGTNYTATATHDITVQLPQRTTRLSGTSDFVHTELISSSGKTTTDHWTAGSIGIVTTTGSRTNSFSLSNVDLTRVVVTDNGGAVVSRTTRGTCTLSAVIDGVSLGFVWRSDADVRLDIDGLPTAGAWSLLLPRNLIGLKIQSIGPLRWLTVEVDHGIYLPLLFIKVDDLPFLSG